MAGRDIRKIDEDMILEMLRVEYDRRLAKLSNLDSTRRELSALKPTDNHAVDDDIISPGLVLKHKRSGIKYQVIGVEDDDVTIVSPEGARSTVSMRSISSDYLID
jgi:hypothetical protein